MMIFTERSPQEAEAFFYETAWIHWGKVNTDILREMINGQKVVKVFCHEHKAEQEFDILNEELCENASEANKLVNILGPYNGKFRPCSICSYRNGWRSACHKPNRRLDIGNNRIIPSAQPKLFTQPITQIAQQINAFVMALAGAKREFLR